MRFSNSVAQRAFTVLPLAISVSAFWRMPCLTRSGLARIDPLVSLGEVAQHVHAIHGSNGFSDIADTAQLLAGSCTSCEVTQDKSAYWTPALYFQSSTTGQFTLVDQVGGMLAYYLLYPNAGNTSLTGFPTGFEMISGDSNQRNFSYPVPDIDKSNWNVAPYNTQEFLRQAALGFNCLDYAASPEGSLYRHFLPDKAYLDQYCTNGVRFELMFPSCWNGKDITTPNKKDHVAFPSEVMTGDCPTGFETRLPSLFYETIWNTYAFKGQDGEFVISNGDPTGYGYHGDFIMGWDEKFLQSAVDTCTNASGQVQDCPLFTLQDSAAYSSCNISSSNIPVVEQVSSSLSALPGNVAIESGPAAAGGAVAGATGASTIASAPAITTSASAAVPTLSYSAGSSISSGSFYEPGGVFAAKISATVIPSSVPSPATTSPAPTLKVDIAASSSSSSVEFFSTEINTSAGVVNEILWVEEEVTITASETATVTVSGGSRKRHLHKHRRNDF